MIMHVSLVEWPFSYSLWKRVKSTTSMITCGIITLTKTGPKQLPCRNTVLHAVWCPLPFWNNDLTALCGCQVLLSFKPIRSCFCRVWRQPMSLGGGAGVAAPLPGPLTGLQSLMMDEHCPLAGFTSDRCQTTADACSTPCSARLCTPL